MDRSGARSQDDSSPRRSLGEAAPVARRADLHRRQQPDRGADCPAHFRHVARAGAARRARHRLGDAYVVGHLQRRLIAFDLDGTLIDSSRDLANSVNELLGELGAPPLPIEEVKAMIGSGAKVLIRRALAASGIPEDPDAIARFLEIYDRRLLDHTVPYEGITDVVRAARQHARVAVLTNKPLAPTEKVLAGLRMRELFDDGIGRECAFPRKPDPTALRALMERASATP